MYSAALHHSLLLYNSHQLTYYWAHAEVKQASRHHVMRASRDVVNYAKQCSSLVSLSRSPSPHHPPLRPRHHVSIPGQHILHVFVIVVTYISRNCYMHLSNCYMYITPSTPIEAWLPCLNPRAALPSRNCRAFTLFLAFDPLKTTREPLSSLSDSLHTLTGTLFVWLFNITWEY